jgi:hypothetical protein
MHVRRSDPLEKQSTHGNGANGAAKFSRVHVQGHWKRM